MSSARTVELTILGKDKYSQAANSAGKSTDQLGRKMSKVGGIAKGALKGGAVAAAVGVAVLGKQMLNGVKAAARLQVLAAKSAAVIKSTGNEAHISVKGIQRLAASLEDMSGVDEELIINSQNVLATFTQIRNTKFANTFDQATKAALDMSVALGTDLQGATMQIGKALNDPIKGVTKLTKAGVSFTEKQKEQIKVLSESGKTQQAQAIILKELGKEFGGAAKAAGSTFNGSVARLKDTLDDMFRSIGTALLPSLQRLADWLSKKLPGAISTVKGWFSKLRTSSNDQSSSFGKMKKAGEGLWSWITGSFVPALRKLGQDVLPSVKKAVRDVSNFLEDNKGFFRAVGTVITKVLLPALGLYVKFMSAKLRAQLKVTGAALKVFAGAFKYLATKALDYLGWIINAAANAFGWVPGIGPKLKRAAAAFNAFKTKVNRAMSGIRGSRTIRINTVLSVKYQGGGAYNYYNSRSGTKVTARAIGGPVRRGMPYLVGERGPELFMPNQGGKIATAGATKRMAGGGAAGGGGDVFSFAGATIYGFDDFAAKVEQARQSSARAGRGSGSSQWSVGRRG